jgi:hypothetical protein
LLGRGTPGRSTGHVDRFTGKPISADSIEFRVARTDAPVRRLRLTGNRYTFGSAEGCSIRLNDKSLRPMHAVLIRDLDRVLVRAYSVPVEVNDNRVTEATLTVGDRLRLGEYEFELISISTADPSRRSQMHSRSIDPRSPSAADIDADEVVWRQRLRKEIDQWRTRQVECDDRESRCDEREAHLRGRESELWSRAENLYRREAKLQDQESAVYQLHDEYAERQQELLRLRDDANSKQRLFQQRESEFVRQEIEYHQKLEEATAQLLQSQAQAASATEAVQEMRHQFDALNKQIEELSLQQSKLRQHEETERDENQRVRGDLELQRDAAIDAQAESEARHREALARVDEMTAELETLRSQQNDAGQQSEAAIQREAELQAKVEAGESAQQQLQENEALIESLRQQIEVLQETVDEASEEANQLRSDYRDALDSVRQLESLVAQSNQRGDTDRAQWATDADSLRAEIESLSNDLERTREELDELRTANESLTTRLHEVELERDQAKEEISDRPTREAFDHLRGELENANQTLAQLRQEIEISTSPEADSPQSPSSLFADSDTDDQGDEAPESLLATDDEQEDYASIDSDANGGSAWEMESSEIDQRDLDDQSAMDHSSADAVIIAEASTEDEAVDEVWPTYEMSEPASSIIDEHSSELGDDNALVDSDDPEVVAESSHSVWGLDSADEQPEEVIENTGVWNSDQAEVAFSDIHHREATEGFVSPDSDGEVLDEPSAESQDEVSSWNDTTPEEDDEQDQPHQGSLASLLIADLDNSDDIELEKQSEQEDLLESVAPNDPSVIDEFVENHLDAEASSDAEVDEEQMGLMALLSSESSDDVESQADEELHDHAPSPWDREYPEEMDSESLSQSMSESIWDIDEENGADDNAELSNAELSNAEPDNADPEPEPFEVTAMMPSSIEMDDDDQVEVESFAVEEQEIDQVDDDSVDQTVPDLSSNTVTGTAGDAHVDDDSIEAYMNRLLGRVQGNPGEAPTSPADSVSLSSVSVNLDTPSEAGPTDASAVIAPQTEMDPDAPLVPRSKAPERNSDLSAMRALANQSARSAISRSVRIQTRNMQMAGMMNFGVAVVAVLFGLGGSFLLNGGLLYLAWLMALIVAVISIRDGLRNLSDARARLQAAERGELQDEADNQANQAEQQNDDEAKAEARLAEQNAAAHAAREQHRSE